MPLGHAVRLFGPSNEPATFLPPIAQQEICRLVAAALGDAVALIQPSVLAAPGGLLALARCDGVLTVVAIGRPSEAFNLGRKMSCGLHVAIAPAVHDVLATVRKLVPFLRPQVGGLRPSFGFGDRLGLATPGHIAALRQADPQARLFPILAQQSVRELTRTQRSPVDVVDAATAGAWLSGWAHGFGADADHVKTEADINAMLAAGFTFFTLDPSDMVNASAERMPADELHATSREVLATCLPDRDVADDYVGRTMSVPMPQGEEPLLIEFDPTTFARCVVKYGRAVVRAAELARHIAAKSAERAQAYELEISIDETPAPTTLAEHLFIARELRVLGVAHIVSIAPRFIGDFEKATEYRGDPAVFEADVRRHAAIARAFGPYKLSMHSGSDKFSIYAAFARGTAGATHVKTAGTSYLEALRVIVRSDADLFRHIVAFARTRFEIDRATYYLNATLDGTPAPESLKTEDLERQYLDTDNGRQILHVTFGSVLSARVAGGAALFRGRIQQVLAAHSSLYQDVLTQHFARHVEPLIAAGNGYHESAPEPSPTEVAVSA